MIEGVGDDVRGPLRAGVHLHHLIEGASHVEHHRVQLSAGLLDLRGRGHQARIVGQLRQPQRLSESSSRIDREYHY